MSFILDLHTFGAFPGRSAIMRPDRFNNWRSPHSAHGRPVTRGECTTQRLVGTLNICVCVCHCVTPFVGTEHLDSISPL